MTTRDVEIVTGMFREADELLLDAGRAFRSGDAPAAEVAEHEARMYDAVGVGALLGAMEVEE